MESPPPPLNTFLKTTLLRIHSNPPPNVPNPPTCKKRASVALIIRIRPTSHPLPPPSSETTHSSPQPFAQTLDDFFSLPWVQTGDPEILFIKRAARAGDRWTSHVALPGGKREAGDKDDAEAAVRETREEVGLELEETAGGGGQGVLYVGGLAERVISTQWGKVPLMVLCPHIYLLTNPHTPPLHLQPIEVASAHWVPLRVLLTPTLRTTQKTDVSDRLILRRNRLTKSLFRLLTGQLVCRATQLLPSESHHATFDPGFPSLNDNNINKPLSPQTPPLILWGLTLGIISDFLLPISAPASATLGAWPTFSHPDIRLILWLLTYYYRKQRVADLQFSSSLTAGAAFSSTQNSGKGVGIDGTTVAVSGGSSFGGEGGGGGGGGGGGDGGGRGKMEAEAALAGAKELDEYFSLMRRAVVVAFGVRVGVGVALAAVLVRRWYVSGRVGWLNR